MFDNIKRLGTETAVYGISTIVGRFLNFLLVPFYTNILPPSEYGIVSYAFSLIAFMNVVYGYGMESAYFRYSATLEIGSKEQNFNTPFISLFLTSTLLSSLLALMAPTVSTLVALPPHQEIIVTYASWILLFDTLSVIPFAYLRMQHKAGLFASLKSFNIVLNVGANLILLLVYDMGIEGIFLSNLIASASTFLLLVPIIQKQFSGEFSTDLYRSLLKFGLPYVPAGIAAMMIQVVDRPILRLLTDDATVGIYQANYRLGIFMMLIVQMYDYAWRPFFLSHAQDANAKQMFARILTYFVLFMSIVFLVLTLFLPDIVRLSVFGRHLIHPDYWGALGIVPIVLLGYLFLGVSNNFVAGIYIQKKTHFLPPITFVGAAVNVGANFLLIPHLGAYGAAWATLLSYLAMATVLYFMVQRVYPVEYEWGRLVKIMASCGIVTALYYAIPFDGTIWKAVLVVVFCASMSLMKFFDKEEIGIVKKLWERGTNNLPPDATPSA